MEKRLIPTRAGFAAALALGLAAAGSSSAVASTSPAPVVPDEITVQVLAANGSGCPTGTASVRPAPDRTGFHVYYRAFTASAGTGSDATDLRKNCQLSLLVNVPAGLTFAVARADYYGSAHLPGGATGLLRTNYYLQGSSANNYVNHTFTGPVNGRWSQSDAAPEMIYAPCGASRILNVNTELRVDAPDSDAATSLSMTSSAGSASTFFNVDWHEC